MKTILTATVTALVLALPAGAGFVHRPRHFPAPSKVDIVHCAPRIDGIDGYFCAELPNQPDAHRAKATILFVKQGDQLIGVRQAVRP